MRHHRDGPFSYQMWHPDHGRNLILSPCHCPYIRPWKEPNPLTMSEWHNPIQWWKTLTHNEEIFMHLYLTWKELNPLAMNIMALPLHLTYSSEWHNPTQWWKTLNSNEERFLHLHLTWKELNPLAMNRMALPLHLTCSSEWHNPT